MATLASAPEAADALAQAIAEGLPAVALRLQQTQIDRLAHYLRLLANWNRVYNLSGIRDSAAMVAPHILDSLAVHAYVTGPRALDIGSGAGLPGIPLAIAKPDIEFMLLDANSKKTRFMQQAAIELRLDNVGVMHARIEDYRPRAGFDTVLCRAFASLAEFVERAMPVCAPGGRLLAMKAALSNDEQQAISAMIARVTYHRLKIPCIKGERQLVEIIKA